jgi:hypothetical protein
MPAAITEFFNAGLTTARHPALLAPGELQRADDCVHRDKDPAIWRAPGRVALNATALGGGTAVKGLFHAPYERSRTDQLLATATTALWRSNITAAAMGTIDALSFSEVGGPKRIAGTATSTAFVATTGFPFLADIVGAKVYGIDASSAVVPAGTYVTAVSVQSGSTGHYSTLTLSNALTNNGATNLAFDYGCVQTLEDSPSGAGAEILDGAQYGAAYFIWFGHGTPQRVSWRGRPVIAGTGYDDTLVMRPVGLDAVRSAPTITEASDAAYAWNPILGAGYYWFLITEIFAPGGDVMAAEKDPNLNGEIVESAYLAPDPTSLDPSQAIGRPIAVNVSATTGKAVSIVFPAVTNTGVAGRLANNWGVYMYGPTADGRTAPSLAQFRRVATYAMTTQVAGLTKILTETSLAPQLKFPTARATDDGSAEFESAANMLGAIDRQTGFAKSGSGADAPGVNNAVEKLSGYVFDVTGSYATASIVGIQVQMTGNADKSGNTGDLAGYYVHVDTSGKHTPRFLAVADVYRTYYHGGPLDTLGVAWVVGDLSTISVTIGKTGTASKQRLSVDAVGLKVFFTGGQINLNGPAYRVVTFRDQIGLTVSEPVNLPQPDCSTGCFFQGSLVCNDLSDETAIRFSLPGKPEAFPKPYVMRFNATKKRDRVKYVNTLSQYLIVGLENSIERVGYLPRETDTDLESGLAHEPLAADHGIPGPFAAVKFDMPGESTLLAYASVVGPMVTNGIFARPLSSSLDWSALVKTSALGTAVFKCYPKEKWLVLYYCPAGATHSMNTRAIVFHYQSDKLKSDGTLPVTGPMVVSGRAATEVNAGGVSYLITGHETTGFIYQEDRGLSVPSGYQVRLDDNSGVGNGKATLSTDVTISPFIRTRKMYAAGMNRDMRTQEILLLFSPYGAAITAASTTTVNSTTVTSSAAFGSVLPGMRVKGTGIDTGTIVLSKASSSSITLSRAANASGTATLSFDTGTIAVTHRGSGIGEAVAGCDTQYGSTLTGDLIEFHNDNARQGLEFQFEKVPLTFDANHDTLTSADLATNMRLHQFTLMTIDGGPEMNRSTA